jgi:hypothetical protein
MKNKTVNNILHSAFYIVGTTGILILGIQTDIKEDGFMRLIAGCTVLICFTLLLMYFDKAFKE